MIAAEPNKSELLIAQLGWQAKPSGVDHVAIETCPICHTTTGKFYMHIGGERDGMWDCKKCGESGNLYQLRERLGLRTEGMMSIKDSAGGTMPASLPDVKALHWRLRNDANMDNVLDYLVYDRGLSNEVIDQYKIGAEEYKDQKWLVIPYLDAAGNPIFVKYRSVPPSPKAFRSSPGREAPLFNSSCLTDGMEELVFVEGEIDCLSLLSKGYQTVVGVPGAAVQKAAWIETIDRLAPKTIYTLFDLDKAGQAGARELAMKLGIEKVKNILLPQFGGKDVNEWFQAGKTLDELLELKSAAKPFDVQGVQSLVEVIEEFRAEVEGRGVDPTFTTMWPSLNRRVGGFEPGDLVGWSAEGKVGKTTLLLNLLDWHASLREEPALLHCLEMTPKRLIRKWISYITQTDDTPGRSQITVETIDRAMEIGRNMKADLLFGYQRVRKSEEAFELIYQAVRRYGVKVVGFDNLQLLVRSLEHSAQETSRVTKDFKAMAMELKILIHLIIQPNRVAEGQIVAARNAAGSSAIEKDVDAFICLHRNRVAQIKAVDFKGFMDTEDNFEPQMLVRADLTRFAPGGTCTLFMQGATSTVREMNDADILVTPTPNMLEGIPTEQVAV
jgi:hypothetical protein